MMDAMTKPKGPCRAKGMATCLKPAAFAVSLLLAGCAAGPNYVRPDLKTPQEYTETPSHQATTGANTRLGESQSFDAGRDLPARWWELFRSPALDDLVVSSIKANPDLEAAQAALRSAKENVYAQQGYWYPTVEVGFTPSRQKVAGTLASSAASGASYYNLYTAQVSVSYTADVFGGNRRQVESLQAQADQQRFQMEATYLTLTSNVVAAAIQEASLREQIAVTKKIIAGQSQLMNMFRRQYDLGQVAVADVAGQEAALAAAEATLPPLEKQLAQQRDLIKVLAGKFPSEELPAQFDLASFTLPTDLPLALPSSLVEHRPDIRAAEENLHAACAAVGVAAANRLPNFTLGVSTYGSSALTMASLFKSGTGFWELVGGVTQPIFDGGTLKHRESAAVAAYEQARAQYRSTALTAYQNVADSLEAIRADAVGLQAALKAERAAAKSYAIAKRQVELGDASVLTLLGAEQTYLQAELALVQAQSNRLSDSVALFQALGGGWWNRENAS